MKYLINYRGKQVEIERLPDGKFKKPDFVKELESGYAGWQPKPAIEFILLVQKNLSEKSYVDQALSNGKGVTWLDSCRIPFTDDKDIGDPKRFISDTPFLDPSKGWNDNSMTRNEWNVNQGRFPANLLVSDDILNDGTISKSPSSYMRNADGYNQITYGKNMGESSGKLSLNYGDSGSYSRYFDLDKWFDTTFPFLAIPKASTSEKNKGLDKWISKVNDGRQTPIDNPFQRGETVRKNIHPTVKPLKLMSWLITLLSRPQDIVLDPFVGSGTTALAAKMLNRRWIGIEKNSEYIEIAQSRLLSSI